MLKINDLLAMAPSLRGFPTMLEMNPMIEDDALQEAQILDVRFDALAGVMGVIFELRQALQLRDANTGVLVTRGVRELTWSGPARDTALTAWSVGSSIPHANERLFTLNLVMWPYPGARLSVMAESAAFFIGDVVGLSEAPPDYSGRDRVSVAGGVATWESQFELVGVSFLDSDK